MNFASSNPFELEIEPSNPFLDNDNLEDVSEPPTPQPIPESSDEHVDIEGSEISADRVSYEVISKQLIKDGFVLTALELHTELQEIGKPVAYLRDHFSNPGNFERTKPSDNLSTSPQVGLQRSGSIQTFDSLDWARYSDDGDRQAEERVAGLEFELRRAQDTIKSLRKALTIATENSGTPKENSEQTSASTDTAEQSRETIKPHEKRAINFLVNEYLLIHDYKLSSVTFAEENENQDFENWDDVGLNISKPPDLLHLYLDYGKHVVPVIDSCDASTNDDFYQNELIELQKSLEDSQTTVTQRVDELTALNLANESLNTNIEMLNLQINSLQDKLESAEQSLAAAKSHPQRVLQADSTDHVDSGPESSTPGGHQLYTYKSVDRNIPSLFLTRILSMSFHVPEDNRIAKQVSLIDSSKTSTIVDMISQSLPHIVPNVLLAKREELLPLILCAANLHVSAKARDTMLNTLFNLIKRPDELQRQMILAGCVMFAQHNGPEKVEEELLPQCWEQINDRHLERRLLVAEACGALIPYISKSIRGSLLLSMLQQMLLDERVEEVRSAIVRSLGILVCFIDDTDKFSQVLTLYGRHVLPDTSAGVQREAVGVLLPSLSLWAVHLDKISDIMDLLFTALQNSLTEPNEENEIKVIAESFMPGMQHLLTLVNFQFVSLLYSGPYRDKTDLTTDNQPTSFHSSINDGSNSMSCISCLVSDEEEYKQLVSRFLSHTSEEWYKSWDQFDLLVYTTFSRFAMLGLSIQAEDMAIAQSLVNYVRSVCAVLGHHITSDKIEPKMSEFFKLDSEITSQHYKVYTSVLLPMLLCGVKAAFSSQSAVSNLIDCLRKFIVTMSEGSVPLQSLELSVQILMEKSHLVEPFIDLVLEVLMKGSVKVKVTCAHLLEICLLCPTCATLINDRILPGLVTLACDTDYNVKLATVSPFGSILETCSERETMDKVYTELIRLLHHTNQNQDNNMLLSMISTFSRIGPNIEPQFREEVVISQLARWSMENNSCGDTNLRKAVAVALIDAYCALYCCFISTSITQDSFLPGLKSLQLDLKELGLEGGAVIGSMVSEIQHKLEGASASPSRVSEGTTPATSSPSTEPHLAKSSKSLMNKIMDKSASTKMSSFFSKRK